MQFSKTIGMKIFNCKIFLKCQNTYLSGFLISSVMKLSVSQPE